MANRRMFSRDVVESDRFLDLPLTTQALYFHLGMNADDDGFVSNPKGVKRYVGASDNDLELLFTKAFIMIFESGVILITHWKQNNFLRSDRYKSTVHLDEKAKVSQTKSGEYVYLPALPSVDVEIVNTDDSNSGIPTGIPMVNQRYTNRYTNGIPSIGEDSIEKKREEIGKESECVESRQVCRSYDQNDSSFSPSNDDGGDDEKKGRFGEFRNVRLTANELLRLQKRFPDSWQRRVEALSAYMASKGKRYKSHYATLIRWSTSESQAKRDEPSRFQADTDDRELPY